MQTYMGVNDVPPVEKMVKNKFIGSVKLSDEERSTVQAHADQ